LGALKQFPDKIFGTLLLRTDIYNSSLNNSLTAGMSFVLAKKHAIFTISGAYMDRTLRNLGTAIVLQNSWLQFTLATDNFLVLLNPRTARNLGLYAGVNIFFGCKQGKYMRGKKRHRFQRPPDACPAYDMAY
jgi:hypothetical protein